MKTAIKILWIGLLLLTNNGARAAAQKCEKCHTLEAWETARFNHAKTNFPLRGAHQNVLCGRCHAGGEYKKIQGTTCKTCHIDPHTGKLGNRCENCHTEESWRSSFGVEAHRKTNFPLTGRHALIPCQECHPESGEKTFARRTLACFDCHAAELAVAATKGTDHAALGFGNLCRQCHVPYSWARASFPQHNQCFPLRGAHGGFSCTDCHSSLVGLTFTGFCSSGTTSCIGCHTGAHSQANTDPKHVSVLGYQYQDQKCRECHHTP